MTQLMPITINSRLFIRGLELKVHLGWPDNERQEPQVVHLDVDIWFKGPPKACITDNLDDTICYSTLVDEIRNDISTKKFHLIEYLSREIHQFIKSRLSDQSRVTVRITKHTQIQGLTGGVCFGYEDAP
jgi:dihydroneopterin aldolase